MAAHKMPFLRQSKLKKKGYL